MQYKLSPSAIAHLASIYEYSYDQWGEHQADIYIEALYDCFEKLSQSIIPWRSIPFSLETEGYMHKHQRHYIYFTPFNDNMIHIFAILHEKRLQIDLLKDI